MKGFFVTATSTDIGKTWVCRMAAGSLARRNIKTAYCKPVQTGCCVRDDGTLDAPDFESVRQSGVLAQTNPELCSPFRFVPAVSPHLAARMADEYISIDRIEQTVRELSGLADCVIVEGAGGLYAPVSEDVFMINIAQRLDLPVIMVCSPLLGTLNHTILSVRALRERNIPFAGCIMNNKDGAPRDEMVRENFRFIESYITPVPLCEVDKGENAGASFERFIDELAAAWL